MNENDHKPGKNASSEKNGGEKQEFAPEKKLYKSSEDVIITGVCDGIANYFNVSSILVRLLFIVTTFLGGWGIIAYILAAFLIPPHPKATDPKLFGSVNARKLYGIILIVTGFYFTFRTSGFLGLFNLFGFTHSLLFPVFLGFTGLWILVKGESQFSYSPVVKKQRLLRSRNDRRLLGLCGGLSEYLFTDVNVIRLLWLLLSFITLGIGVIVYFVLSIFINSEEIIVNDAK